MLLTERTPFGVRMNKCSVEVTPRCRFGCVLNGKWQHCPQNKIFVHVTKQVAVKTKRLTSKNSNNNCKEIKPLNRAIRTPQPHEYENCESGAYYEA